MGIKGCAFAVDWVALRHVGAVGEPAGEELDGDDGEDEVEEEVHDQDVGHVLDRLDHAVEHRLPVHNTIIT